MSRWELTWRVKVVHVRPLRAAQDVWKLVDVFNCVFEGLYLGQGLSSLAVIRRQVVTELVQSLCKTPHPHLLPLAGLHASFDRHLGLAQPLGCWSRAASTEAEREIVALLMPAAVAHLRWRAHGVHRGLRWGGLTGVLVLCRSTLMALPLRQHFRCKNLQIHARDIPRHPDVRAARMATRVNDRQILWRWFSQTVFI